MTGRCSRRILNDNCKSEYPLTCLVENIAKGNKRAEHELILRYRPDLLKFLHALTKDLSLAEDFTHDAFIVVLKKLRNGELEQACKLESYLFQTARYTYFGWLRKGDSKLEFRDSIEAEIHSNLENDLYEKQTRSFLESFIKNLKTARDRDVLARHYLFDQGTAEICDALGLPTDRIHSVMSRARLRLRNNVLAQVA